MRKLLNRYRNRAKKLNYMNGKSKRPIIHKSTGLSIWISICMLIVSIVAALVSVSTLYIYYQQHQRELRRDKLEQANLVLTYVPHESNIFFKIANSEDKWNAPYRMIVHTRIENLSEKPITITEFQIETSNLLYTSSKTSNPGKGAYQVYRRTRFNNLVTINIPIADNQLRPLMIIEPWGAREGIIFFIYQHPIKDSQITGTLKAITTRGEFSTKVKVFNAETYFDEASKQPPLS